VPDHVEVVFRARHVCEVDIGEEDRLSAEVGAGQHFAERSDDAAAAGAQDVSDEMRRMQSGNIRSYAGWVAVGAAAVIAFMVWRGAR